MNCQQAERLLSAQSDGTLSAPDALSLAAHLTDCQVCRRRQATFESVQTELRTLAELAPESGLASRVVARWQAERPVFALSVLLALLILVAVATTRQSRHAHSSPAPPLVMHGQEKRPKAMLTEQPDVTLKSTQKRRSVPIPPSDRSSPSQENLAPKAAFFAPVRKSVSPPTMPTPQDDLAYINAPSAHVLGRWTRLLPDKAEALEAWLQKSVRGGDDFVTVPMPRLASLGNRALAAAIVAYRQEKEIVDARLIRKVSPHSKATSFANLCQHLRDETGIELTAGRNVADDKVTIFCTDQSLRDLMRQITHVFGFSWYRSGEEGAYKYELAQDVRGQLLEEELRNRDRHEALLALDRDMQRYRTYLSLTPQQVRALAATATGEDKKLLNNLVGAGWGPAHLYFGLSPDELAALQGGQELVFHNPSDNDFHMPSERSSLERPLPADMQASLLQVMDNVRIHDGPEGLRAGMAENGAQGVPPSAFPGASAYASLHLDSSDTGPSTLSGMTYVTASSKGSGRATMGTGYALGVGVSPSLRDPQNELANAKLANDPTLQKRVRLHPNTSYPLKPGMNVQGGTVVERVTTADVWEAVHNATGMNIVADYFTHLYTPQEVSVAETTLFQALNRVCDTLRQRWNLEDGWLQFRSTGFFNDRPKEVPNRLLTRWADSRKQHGALTLDDLIEIAQLPDAQQDSGAMADGARACFGLQEWELACTSDLRPHWRFLATLSPGLRRAAESAKGLTFGQMSLSQQQQFITLAVALGKNEQPPPLTEMADAALHIDYEQPGTSAAAQAEDEGPQIGDLLTLTYTYHMNGSRWKRVVKPHREQNTTY
jgi:hypothetical protein